MTQNSWLKTRLGSEGAMVRLGSVTLVRRGDRVIFSGSPTGEHSLDYAESSGARLIAHAKGYVGFTLERRRADD
jgi:hypothetical protein